MKLPAEVLRQSWFLAGPTAVGKTASAVFLARQINGEIVSMDSMAIYRGMDIGTAKPSVEERRQVPHHLVDIVDPSDDFSTAAYLDAAELSAREILCRGRTPLFVGGTGLYLRALLRGVFEGPPADWEFRHQLQDESQRQSPTWLWERLSSVDPSSAARLHPQDARRLIRALEIHHLTGTPVSQLQAEQALPPHLRPDKVFWLHPPRDWLYARINARVEQMFDLGLLDEVRQLLMRDPPIGRTARQALGYREVIDWLEGRIATRQELLELIQTRTRQFAKRQHTWFRNLAECHEIHIEGGESGREICSRILAY